MSPSTTELASVVETDAHPPANYFPSRFRRACRHFHFRSHFPSRLSSAVDEPRRSPPGQRRVAFAPTSAIDAPLRYPPPAALVFVLFAVMTISFFMLRAVPGGPFTAEKGGVARGAS